MLVVDIQMLQTQWWESLLLAEALHAKMGPCPILRVEFENRTPMDETHSSLLDSIQAFQFLIPSKLEGKWGVVDQEAGGLADA